MTNFELLVKKLIKKKKTISSMESCTGGSFASEITNIPHASQVIGFSAITYSNEFKIKMGVNENIIKKHSVYSIETAKEMSKNISEFSNSNYGIGITGKLNRKDEKNDFGSNNKVYISIYDKDKNEYINFEVEVTKKVRKNNKEIITNKIAEELLNIL